VTGRAAVALVALACAAHAQAPDLSGRWTLVVEPPDAAAPAPPLPATASSGWGREITIAQGPGRVTIERHQFAELDVQPPMVLVYRLDGTESRNVLQVGRGPQEQVARAEMKDGALVIATRHAAGTPLAAEVRQTLALDASGALVVETTRTAGAVVSTTKARYARRPVPAPTP
jgi:hypothetical protein